MLTHSSARCGPAGRSTMWASHSLCHAPGASHLPLGVSSLKAITLTNIAGGLLGERHQVLFPAASCPVADPTTVAQQGVHLVWHPPQLLHWRPAASCLKAAAGNP